MNKYDIHRWIIKVINSCETLAHWAGCFKLIKSFNKMYSDEELDYSLRIQHTFKFEEINKLN